jgi:hypothetical protein
MSKDLLVDPKEFWSNIVSFSDYNLDQVSKYFNQKHRSSTIFPVYKKINSRCYISCLTYWIKKHDSKVAIKLTARNIQGYPVESLWKPIDNYFAFNFDVNQFNYFKLSKEGFCGSLEFEVYFPDVPKFTFPAVSLFYEDLNASSVVHSCMRIYNLEEKINDYATDFPQTGFDVIFGITNRNYILFFGGNKSKYKLNFLLEWNDKVFVKEIEINNIHQAQQHVIFVEDLFSIDEKEDLFSIDEKSLNAKISIEHNLDVFPRFYVGVIQQNSIPTLTHTFFDTSNKIFVKKKKCTKNFRSKNISSEKYFDSAIIVPLLKTEEFNTSIRTYAQNLEFRGEVTFKIFESNGNLIHNRIINGDEASLWNEKSNFNLSKECEALGLAKNIDYNLYFGFDGFELGFPKRFKMGLNIKKVNSKIGTNICFSPLVQTDLELKKPFSRKWFPLGGPSNFIGTIHLTSFSRYSEIKPTYITIEFINTRGQKLFKENNLFLNQSIFIDVSKDIELKSFFNNELGWCFVTASSYCVDAFYFSTRGDQIGGDHAF